MAVCSTCAAQVISADGRPLCFEKERLSGGRWARAAANDEPWAKPLVYTLGVDGRAPKACVGAPVIRVETTT